MVSGLQRAVDSLALQTFMIFDLRSKMNVIGNQLKGKGSETPTYYANCVVLFMGMKNIHAIRESFQQVVNRATSRSASVQEDELLCGAGRNV